MSTHQNYNIKFVNVKVDAWGGIIDKQPSAITEAKPTGFLYSPLSIFLYMSAFYGGEEEINYIISILDNALNGVIGDPDIPVEMTVTTLLNNTTVHIQEENTINEITLPIADLKVMLLEYKTFLNTPPFKGSRG